MKEQPPNVVPLFPLTGMLLLPGNFLPLNVFEPRYRNLVRDALSSDAADTANASIGMIQPRVPGPDNWGCSAAPADPELPDLYQVGCLGRICECERQPDGRYHLLLRGERRFRVVEELPLKRGYRRVIADFVDFPGDLAESAESAESVESTEAGNGGEPAPEGAVGRLLDTALAFADGLSLEFDRDLLSALPPVRLLNALAASLPFAAGEKQALLEAPTPAEREAVLLTLMQMTTGEALRAPAYQPPTIH